MLRTEAFGKPRFGTSVTYTYALEVLKSLDLLRHWQLGHHFCRATAMLTLPYRDPVPNPMLLLTLDIVAEGQPTP